MRFATALQPKSLRTRLAPWVRNSPLVRYPDLGLMCVGVFVMLVGVGAVVPIRTIYARDHGADMQEIGWMASAFILGGFLVQFPAGWASDRIGRKPLLVAGVALSGVITLLMLASNQPWWFIALRFAEGITSGMIGPASNAYVIDSVPAKERGAAYGWLGSAFSAGFMMGPALGGVMVDWFGYASPFIFGGVMSLITSVFLILKMANRKPGSQTQEDEAEQVDGTHVRRRIPPRLFIPALLGAMLFIFGGGFADGLFISIWSIWLSDLHASNSFIGLTFITFSLPLMVLMPITGKMADNRRLTPLMVIPVTAISAIYLIYGFITSLPLIALLGLVEGTLVAISGPALSAYIANLSPERARGRLQGVISMSRTLSGFVSSQLVAGLYGINMGYPFMVLAGVQLFIGLVGGLLVWRVERRSIRTSVEEARALEATLAA